MIYVLRFAHYRDNIFANVYVGPEMESSREMGYRKARRLHKQRNKEAKIRKKKCDG